MLCARFFCFCCCVTLFFVACDAPSTPTPTPTEEPKDTMAISFSNFLQQLKQAESGQDISSTWSAAFIAPALEKDTLYPYLSTGDANYQYGEIIYEDSSLVALSFYYKALDGRSLLAASFLASYDKASAACLDIRPIFSSSTFDKSATEGYQLGLSCQSTLNYIDNGSLGILQLNSKVKLFYTALEEGVPPPPNEVFSYQHVLQPNGHFATRLLQHTIK